MGKDLEKRILFVTPESFEPSGGIKQLYRMVDVLNNLGYKAFILHKNNGYRHTWFQNKTPILYNFKILKPLDTLYDSPKMSFSGIIRHFLKNIFANKKSSKIYKDDIIVFPEFYGMHINEILIDNPKVIYVQGCYLTFSNHPLNKNLIHTPYLKESTIGILINSDDGINYFKNVFPKKKVYKVRHAIELDKFSPSTKKKQLAFMSRKNFKDIRQVLGNLYLKKLLDDWSLIDIQNLNHDEVAAILSESTVFLSSGIDEGFGLPALEALASGCLVIGYTGKGGDEYFNTKLSIKIPEKDVQEFIKVTEEKMIFLNNNLNWIDQYANEVREHINERYSLEIEQQDIKTAWSAISQYQLIKKKLF
jgi:glycosyltransferase involved in cell wall biosynthesis